MTASLLHGRSILITGGTGHVGRALVRMVAAESPARLRLLARTGELPNELRRWRASCELVTGDLADATVTDRAVQGMDIVFHLAAAKGITAAEDRPDLAVRTNVMGSLLLLDASLREPSVRTFIAASSDKAANPVSVYGHTKTLLERLVCSAQVRTSTMSLGLARLGSVWGSGGSVIRVWHDALRAGGSIGLTDPDMTRFAMTVQEAAAMLVRAARWPLHGEVLIERLPAFRLADLASAFTRVHGGRIEVIGPRSGEKQREELLTPEEARFARVESRSVVLSPYQPQPDGVEPIRSDSSRRLTASELEQRLREEDDAAVS